MDKVRHHRRKTTSSVLHLQVLDTHTSIALSSSRALRIRLPAFNLQFAGGTGAAGGPGAVPLSTFRGLLANARIDVNDAIFRRAIMRYATEIVVACHEGSTAAAVDIYERTAALPFTATAAEFSSRGIIVNGALWEGSTLTICYRSNQMFVLKPLTELERDRARAFLQALDGHSLPHVSQFELPEPTSHNKCFMLMPRFLDVLERCPALDADATLLLWQQMRTALSAIHGLGFAHMDVKPANICQTESGDFVLIDFGSIARVGGCTQSTPSYLPRELIGRNTHSVTSATSVDWWMLALTLGEKCCDPPLEIGGAKLYAKEEIRTHLPSRLPAAVWTELSLLLD